MNTRTLSVAFSAGVALAVALGCTARADDSSQAPPGQQAAAPTGQARIGETTWSLERAFSDQFVRGQVDSQALAPLVDAVVQAMPEAARSKVAAHIAQVIATGQSLASTMSADQRARVAAAPAAGAGGTTAVPIGIVSSWGWPGYAGWGGIGAFGFPGMYYNCVPYSSGYAAPYFSPTWGGYTSGYSAGNFSSLACGGGTGYGGLGAGGWYW